MRYIYKCNVCDGEDLLFDANAVWDKLRQGYVVLEVADPVAYCGTCETDTEDWGEYPVYRELEDLWEDETILNRLDKSIIEIMDIVRDETGMDCDSDADDYLWGVVYGYVHGGLADAYRRRLSILEDEKKKGVDNNKTEAYSENREDDDAIQS